MESRPIQKGAEMRQTPPSEPGALAGFAWDCPLCGMEICYSLESLTASEARLHLEWHERKGEK